MTEVFEDTPAAKAGFEMGDVILNFGGREVGDPRQLQEVVERSPFGSKQEVDIRRNGSPKKLLVVVESLPDDFGAGSRGNLGQSQGLDQPGSTDNELGLSVSELDEELAGELGYEGLSGVIISSVDPDGIAADAGLRKGMLILRVGRKPVRSVDEFEAATKKTSLREGVPLWIRSRGGNRFVVLKKN